MRIIINITEGKDDSGKKAVVVRTGYYMNGKDCLRVQNTGTEIYNLIVEGFGNGFEGGVIKHEGERK